MRIRKKTYSRPYDEIFEASLGSVKQLGWRLISQNREVGEIKAQTGTTLRSWGEDIAIHLSEEAVGTTISVLSEARFQLIDWGKNEENEKIFYKELEKIISR